MARKTWTSKELDLLRELYPNFPTKEIVNRFPNKTASAIKGKATVLGLRKKLEVLKPGVGTSLHADFNLQEFITDYPWLSDLELHQKHKIGESTVRKLGKKHGLKKKHNKTGQFTENHKPWNKGKKVLHLLSEESRKRMEKTWYKKGNKPENTLHDGAITERKDTKSGIIYKYIRLAEGEWDLLHRHVWRQETGEELKTTDYITFKDGNSLNCEFSNLKKISQAENLDINTEGRMSDNFMLGYLSRDKDLREKIKDYHPELIELKRTQIKLNRKIQENESI